MNLFGRKSAPPTRTGPQATAETIRKLREQLDTLEKRESHLEKKIQLQLMDAKKKSLAKDKRGAIFALKRKKMLEGEIEKLQGARMTLETQCMTLESAHVNMETFRALQDGANQMKAIHGQMSIEKVDNIMDDIQEEMTTADEISRAISQPPGMEMFDEDELEGELDELLAMDAATETIEEQVAREQAVAARVVAPPAPTPPRTTATATPPTAAATAYPQYNLPEVPTHTVQSKIAVTGHADDDELEELRKLEASMAM